MTNWIAVRRYRSTESWIIRLNCGHSGFTYENPRPAAWICVWCGHVALRTRIVALPATREKP